ncbi:DUF1993 domain-containing protein [Tsuneonella rigui]|uniref:DUF1993 domain-containing protein n=1 Tax=Tsuneonella rigui TaxID=1708790 RepID=UPI000F7E9EBC|nr:DUF1993 domain-containing protein [Tsuneonella rigui]
MPLSLHAAYVPTALQIVGATAKLVDKAEEWCSSAGCSEADLFATRLIEDMHPLPFQFASVAHHTHGAVEGVRAGVFNPPRGPFPDTFAACRDLLAQSEATLQGVSADEAESWIGRPMKFEMSQLSLPFSADQFLLSFSQPNYMFHASTVYDILRMRGAQLGKRDFMGRLRIERG